MFQPCPTGKCGGSNGKGPKAAGKKKCPKPLPPSSSSEEECKTVTESCTDLCSNSCENSCQDSCEKPCEEKLSCGSGMITWKDECGNSYVSKIVSLASQKAIESSIERFIDYMTGIYNSPDTTNITKFQISHLGLFAENSTVLQYIGADAPIVGVGIDGCSTMLALLLSHYKAIQKSSTLSMTYAYRLISNDLANITYLFTITLLTGPVKIAFLTQSHVVNCGATLPRVDWGQLVSPPQLPL